MQPGQAAARRWARRVDNAVLFATALIWMTALLLTLALPFLPQPDPGAANCTLVGSTWSCTSMPAPSSADTP